MAYPGNLGGYESRPGSLTLGGVPSVGDLIEMSPGVLAHYRLDEASGTVAHDYRLGHPGAITGTPTWISADAPDPGCVSLPSGAYIATTGPQNFAVGAVEVWFRLSALPSSGNLGLLAGLYDSSSKYDKCLYVDSSGTLHWLVNDGTAKTVASTLACVTGRWYHAVGVADGTNSYLYHDGVSVASTAAGNTIATYTTGNFYIGGGTSATFVSQPGEYDEVATFSSAPTAQEIATRWSQGIANITDTNARITQLNAEVIRDSAGRNARITQLNAEVIRNSSTRNARVTQLAVEVLRTTSYTSIYSVSAASSFSFTPAVVDIDSRNYLISAASSFTFTPATSGDRDVHGAAASSFNFTPASTGVDTATHAASAASSFSFTPASTGLDTAIRTVSASSSFTFTPATSEARDAASSAASSLTVYPSGTDTDSHSFYLAASSSFSFTPAGASNKDGFASGSSSLTFTYAGREARDAGSAAVNALLFSYDAEKYNQHDLFVAGSSSLTVGAAASKKGDFGYMDTSRFSIGGQAVAYVSPIHLSAATAILVSASPAAADQAIWRVSASSSFDLSPAAGEDRLAILHEAGAGAILLASAATAVVARSLSASTSFDVGASAASRGRDVHATAAASFSFTAADTSNQFRAESAAGSFSLTASGTAEVSATLAATGLVFVDLAEAVVWLPWVRTTLARPPGGGLPHS